MRNDTKMDTQLTEARIIKRLHNYYATNSRYRLSNVYVYDWESDFFLLKASGYAYEFEIKISRSDYIADKKKVEKHAILQTGEYKHQRTKWEYDEKTSKSKRIDFVDILAKSRPNRFFYVVPENLISIEEIPDYAGLIYVNGWKIETVKPAPVLHKEKKDLTAVLCDKFYYKMLGVQDQLRRAQKEIDYLKKRAAK